MDDTRSGSFDDVIAQLRRIGERLEHPISDDDRIDVQTRVRAIISILSWLESAQFANDRRRARGYLGAHASDAMR